MLWTNEKAEQREGMKLQFYIGRSVEKVRLEQGLNWRGMSSEGVWGRSKRSAPEKVGRLQGS